MPGEQAGCSRRPTPALVGAAVALVSIKFTRLRPFAEGVLAAVLFGVIFVVVAFAGLSALA